jgi:hypothetical protein
MNMLANLTSDETIGEEKDSVGGSGGPAESGLYNHTVAMAYLNKSAGGAMGLVLSLKDQNNKEVRQTLWMSSGTAKGGKNYYEKDGVKHYLPGFNLANSLCLLAAGKEISAMDTETKVVNVYSYDAKAEVPTKVEVLMDLLGKEIVTGLIKQNVDKTRKNDQTGVYEATGETRDENEIDKFFRASDRMTVAEVRAKSTEAVFANTWDAKWTGKTKERAKGAQPGSGSGVAGAPKGVGSPIAKKPSQSLFAA